MKIPLRKLKRILLLLCLVSVFTGASYLFLTISCNILLCSSNDIKKGVTYYSQEFLDEKKFCSLLKFKKKGGRNYTVKYSPQLGINGSYLGVYDYIGAENKYKVNESVTYSTHTTIKFIKHVAALTKKWDGPISVAVYVPGYDFCSSVLQILKLRTCGNPFIRKQVSWHIYWHKDFPPAIDWQDVVHNLYINCSVEFHFPNKSWRVLKSLQYPINVGRNIARNASKTWFVLPSDIELYPSKNLPKQFLSFISNVNFTKKSNIGKVWPRVYVVPVFEVQNKIPDTKEELVKQVVKREAVYFHQNICPHCQKIPGLNSWLKNLGKKNEIHAFSSVKRHFPYHRWEPIFISTNQEPLYDERLSWEGLQDKMSQMHELCLRNYNLVILDRAFLVHSPGIKRKARYQSPVQDNWRKPFIDKNSLVYEVIMNELHQKLGRKMQCRKH